MRRLRWTRYWWRGVTSLFTGQLRICPQCGAMYSGEGELLAAGAIETDAERRLSVYRKDMAYLRDAFGAVFIAAEFVVIWLIAGTESMELAKVVAAASVGAGSLVPFFYFGRKARLAKRDLKQLRGARQRGQILQPPQN
ncbi:MAG: hypothetical protein GTO05_07155 [Gemmatimonadales bacterium]|nr:hypothetical protein [Gemmatimonadales bacterium]NIS64920.1 hypothetical protein [Gemmatimonadales bacterium]